VFSASSSPAPSSAPSESGCSNFLEDMTSDTAFTFYPDVRFSECASLGDSLLGYYQADASCGLMTVNQFWVHDNLELGPIVFNDFATF
jgi:hypothetical protein